MCDCCQVYSMIWWSGPVLVADHLAHIKQRDIFNFIVIVSGLQRRKTIITADYHA